MLAIKAQSDTDIHSNSEVGTMSVGSRPNMSVSR